MLSQLRNRLLLISMVFLILGFYFYLAQGITGSNLKGIGAILLMGSTFWIMSLISRRNSIIKIIVKKPLWFLEITAAGSASGIGVWILFFMR